MLATSQRHRMSIVGMGLLLAADGLALTTVSLAIGSSSWAGFVGGLILSAYFLGATLGARFAPTLVQAMGPAAASSLFLAAAIVGALLLPMVPVIVVWISLRMASGFAIAGLLTLRADAVDQPSSGVMVAVGSQLLFALGQPLLLVYGPRHVETFMIAAMVFVLGAAVFRSEADSAEGGAGPYRLGATHSEGRGATVGGLVRATPLGVGAVVAAGALVGQMLTAGPIWATFQGLSVGEVSVFMALLLAGGLALQLPLGRLTATRDRRILLAAVAAATALVGTVFAFAAAGTLAVAAPLVLVEGALIFFLFPLGRAHIHDCLEATERVGAHATLLVLFGAGATVGPLLSVSLMASLGPVGFAAAIAIAAAPLAGYAFFLSFTRKVAGAMAQTPFDPIGHPLSASASLASPTLAPSLGAPGASEIGAPRAQGFGDLPAADFGREGSADAEPPSAPEAFGSGDR